MKQLPKAPRHAPMPISNRGGLNNGQKMPAPRVSKAQLGFQKPPADKRKTYPTASGGTKTQLGPQYLLEPGETVVASSRDVTAGTLGWFGRGVNDAYDLYLLHKSGGNYTLAIFMKLQFIFEDTDQGKWAQGEKVDFANRFKKAVNDVWGNRLLKTLKNGKKIYLQCRFNMIIDGWSVTEHWEINVKKVQRFSQSWVNPYSGKVQLDSEDLTPTLKGANMYQRGVVHEFGHMLGLPDEYEVGSPYAKVYHSIMNRGESVLDRHRSEYVKWLNQVLKARKLQ